MDLGETVGIFLIFCNVPQQIVDKRMEFDQAHHPWSIKLQAKQINPRWSKLSDEEILGVESDAIDNIEYQSLMVPSSLASQEFPLIGHRVRLRM